MSLLSAQFVAARVLVNLTVDELSERSGVGRSTIGHIERGGRDPSEMTTKALLSAFKKEGLRFPPFGGVVLAKMPICLEPKSNAFLHGWYMCLLGWDKEGNPFEATSTESRDWIEGYASVELASHAS